MRENSTLRSLCSVNDDKPVLRYIEVMRQFELRMRSLSGLTEDMKCEYFISTLGLHACSMTNRIVMAFHEAVDSGHILGFLSDYSKKEMLIRNGIGCKKLVLNIEPTGLFDYAVKPIRTTLAYMCSHTPSRRKNISMVYSLSYLSNK